MTRKFETFISKDITFKIYEPTVIEYKEASKVRNETFLEALHAKAPLRAQINTLLRARGEWDDEREEQFNDLTRQVLEREKTLKSGGMKLSEGHKIALEMKDIRNKLKELLIDRSTLDSMTAEGQADNAQFNALVALCLVYNNEKGEEERYFKTVEDYMFSNDIVGNLAAQKLSGLMYTIGENAEKLLPENQFLIKWKFVDDRLRTINSDGKLVDSDGRLINEDGRFISSDGKYLDKFGNEVDIKGNYVVVEKPFLDDDGNEILETETESNSG